jgi:pimeloyl-ACP methyl ester carboxylesterase
MKMFFREIGKGSPLLILHGLYGSSDNWMSIGRELAKQHRVFIVDQRNHGRSPHSPNHSYTDLANDILEFVDNQGLSKVNLIGHSMGGKASMLFTALNANRVKGLIVVDISPAGYGSVRETDHRAIISALLGLNPELATTRQQLDFNLAMLIPEFRVRQFLLKNITRDTNGVFRWTFNLDAISKNLSSMMDDIFPSNDGLIIKTPTLFVRGGKSNYITQYDEEKIGTWFEDYRIVTIPKAGHWLHAESPHEFIAQASSFLETLPQE